MGEVAKISREAQFYYKHEDEFMKASEGAFNNIQWANYASDTIPEQSVIFKFDNNFALVCAYHIVEHPRNAMDSGIVARPLWEISTFLVAHKTGRPILASRWTRKQRRSIRFVLETALWGIHRGEGTPSFAVHGHRYVGVTVLTPDDKSVYKAAKNERSGIIIPSSVGKLGELTTEGLELIPDNLSPEQEKPND